MLFGAEVLTGRSSSQRDFFSTGPRPSRFRSTPALHNASKRFSPPKCSVADNLRECLLPATGDILRYTVLRDLLYALRQLRRDRVTAFLAVASLALGVGATTAVFSVIYAALIDPYPYPAADRIVRLTADTPSRHGEWLNVTGSQLRHLQQSTVLQSVIAMDYHAMILTGEDWPENVHAIGLSGNACSDLGLPPILGRGILPSDAPEGQDMQRVVMLSHKFWRKRFFGDPTVVGRKIQLDRQNYEVIGVAAPTLHLV